MKFGKKLEEVFEGSGSSADALKLDLRFADGKRETGFDVVIDREGAWSRVRTYLTNVKPRYSGITLVEMWANDISKSKWLKEFIGAGSMFAFGEGCAVQSQVQGNGSIATYASLRVPEDFVETCGIDWKHEKKAREELVENHFNHIAEDLKKVIWESKDSLTPRKLYELPVGLHGHIGQA